jgi:hypothetical protein
MEGGWQLAIAIEGIVWLWIVLFVFIGADKRAER